jgi:hypothetical protein
MCIECTSGNSFSNMATQSLNAYDQNGCPSTDTDGDGSPGDACTTDTCCGFSCSSWTGSCEGGLVKTNEWASSCSAYASLERSVPPCLYSLYLGAQLDV